MCGIAGIINFNGQSCHIFEIERLTNFLAHRGPDGFGTWMSKDGSVALGHRRLSILDLSQAGKQPMTSVDDNVVIVLNGEIYNFIELKNELISLGFSFRTQTDTEVILCAYQAWGISMLEKFNGMWAFALYDKQSSTLFLSRDRYGVKPLYYFLDREMLLFASEIKALHCYLKRKITINQRVIQSILAFDQTWCATDETYLSEIKSLPGGHNLSICAKKVEISKWYSLRQIQVPRIYKEQKEVFRNLFFDSCKLRLRSDVSIGTCLSGGVDSGSIATAISTFKGNESERFSHYSHRCFSAAFPGTHLDESYDVKLLSRQTGLEPDIQIINSPSNDELEQAMADCDGPMPALAFFPIWKLYKHIKKNGISVTLDGLGPDELLGGYFKGFEAMQGAWQKRDPFWFWDVYKTYSSINPSASEWMKNNLDWFLKEKKRDLYNYSKIPLKKLLSWMKLYHLKPYKNSAFQIKDSSSIPHFVKNFFDQTMYYQFFYNPMPFLLTQYDRCSMANGIESRMPFMDYRLVEYGFSLPANTKVGNGYTKRILRESMEGILPDNVRLKKLKTGFNAPEKEWLLNDLNKWFMDQINSRYFVENPYFDGIAVRKEINEAIRSNEISNNVWKYWPFIHVCWWHKEFVSNH